jgi:phage FluMu protein Com
MLEYTGRCIICGKLVLFRGEVQSDDLTICSKCKETNLVSLDAFKKVQDIQNRFPEIFSLLQMFRCGKCTLIDALSLIILRLKEENELLKSQAILKAAREPIVFVVQRGDKIKEAAQKRQEYCEHLDIKDWGDFD